MHNIVSAIAGIFIGLLYFASALVIPLMILNPKNLSDLLKSSKGKKLIFSFIIVITFLITLYFITPSSVSFLRFSGWTIVLLILIGLFKYSLSLIRNYQTKNEAFKQSLKLILSIIIGNFLLLYIKHPLALNAWNTILHYFK